MGKISENMKAWRKKQPRGAIMKPETFNEIVDEAKGRGLSEERAKKEGGKAYWGAAKKKFKEAKRGK